MNLDASNTAVLDPPENAPAANAMSICIAGWYFRKKFFSDILASGIPAFVVKHREGDTLGIPSALYENRGLEFGAYREYVQNHWDRTSDVLFIHDDTEILDSIVLDQVQTFRAMGVEHCYIFSSAYEELCNGGAHGRAMWIKAETLALLADDFPADMDNLGANGGIVAQKGIFQFHARVLKAGMSTAVAAIVPGFNFGHRGRMNNNVLVFKRVTSLIPGVVANA